MKKIKIGMAQILIEGGKINENLKRAEKFAYEAKELGCDIVVFPECMDIGWTNPKAKQLAQVIPGENSNFLCKTAEKNEIFIVAGLTEKENEKTFNSAILISPNGDILLKHRKINVLSIAQDLYSTGDRLGVAHTPIGTIGINICADNFPHSLVLGHSLARMGAQIIISPSAWAVDAHHNNSKKPYGAMWQKSYGELSNLYDIYIVGVSNVGWIDGGPWDGRKCIGCSLVMGPGGKLIKQGQYGVEAEELIILELDLYDSSITGTDYYYYLKDKEKKSKE